MKKMLLFSILLFAPVLSSAQFYISTADNDTLISVKKDTTLGIGITSPVEKLDVKGGIKLGYTSNQNAGTLRWTGTQFEGYDGSAWLPFANSTPVSDADWQINNSDMHALVSGNIGIGTITPSEKLSVTGNVQISEKLALNHASISDQAIINIGNLTGAQRAINVTSTGADYKSTALYNTVRDAISTGALFGVYNDVQASGGRDFVGMYNDMSLGKAQGMYNILDVSEYGFGVRNQSITVANHGNGWGMFTSLSGSGRSMTGIETLVETSGGSGIFPHHNIAVGTKNALTSSSDAIYQALFGTLTVLQTSSEDSAWALHVTDREGAAGTHYGLYMDLDGSGTNYSVYVEETSGDSYFGSNVGIGTEQPQEKLDVQGNAIITGVLDHSQQASKPKIFNQSNEPDIPNNSTAFWVDSDDNRTWLILDIDGIQKKLELQ